MAPISGLVVQRLPSDQEWERMKPLIRRFYLDEESNLVDVMKIMKDTYGFKATFVVSSRPVAPTNFRQRSDVQEAHHEMGFPQV